MKKLSYVLAVVSLVLPLATFASNDVQLGSDSVISVGGYSLSLSSQNSADQITVNSDSFDVVLSNGSALMVTSADRRSFSASPNTYTVEKTCTPSQSSITLQGPPAGAAAATVTVTPSATATCTGGTVSSSTGGGSSGSSGSSGGGSSGGSSSATPATAVATPTTLAAPATPGATSATPATPATPSGNAQPSARALAMSPVFNSALKPGSANSDVKRLQQLLNSDPDTRIASTGAGSPGKETSLFGPATAKAVAKFQMKYHLVKGPKDQGYGILGPKTRAKLAEVFKGVQAPAPSIQPSLPAATPKTTAPASPASPSASAPTLQQLQDLLARLKALQAQLQR